MQMEPFFVATTVISGIVAFWCAIVYFISWASGWRKLAEQFPDKPVSGDLRCSWRYGRFRGANYKGLLIIAFCSQGIRISVFPLFRLGHPPILLPWSAIKAVEEKGIGPFRYVRMSIDKPIKAYWSVPVDLWLQAKQRFGLTQF